MNNLMNKGRDYLKSCAFCLMESSAAVVLRWEVHLSAQEMHKGQNEDVDEQKGSASFLDPTAAASRNIPKTCDLESSNWKFESLRRKMAPRFPYSGFQERFLEL